jgi:hypothetical protein
MGNKGVEEEEEVGGTERNHATRRWLSQRSPRETSIRHPCPSMRARLLTWRRPSRPSSWEQRPSWREPPWWGRRP